MEDVEKLLGHPPRPRKLKKHRSRRYRSRQQHQPASRRKFKLVDYGYGLLVFRIRK